MTERKGTTPKGWLIMGGVFMLMAIVSRYPLYMLGTLITFIIAWVRHERLKHLHSA